MGDAMAFEIQVYLPGETNPVDLDDYANIVANIAGYGTYGQSRALPELFIYDNPKSGTKQKVGTLMTMRSN